MKEELLKSGERVLMEEEKKRFKIKDLVNVIAGTLMSSALLFIGGYIQAYGPSMALFASMFIGISTGYYIGMALKEEGNGFERFLAGGLVVWAIGFLWLMERSFYLGGLVGCSSVSLFMIHKSGLVEENDRIKTIVSIFSKQFSAAYHWIIGFVYYLWPVLSTYRFEYSVGIVAFGVIVIFMMQYWIQGA